MSLITTPRSTGRAIRTINLRLTRRWMREAIERELDRGGQVFYVYGRIEGLFERAERLRALVPRARIARCHGQLASTSWSGPARLRRR
jgi:transcription-repair coupling factor (superfamily II helicase)